MPPEPHDQRPSTATGTTEAPSRWRRLPLAVRILLIVVVASVVLVFLFTWLFPRVERYFEDPTLGVLVPVAAAALGR